MCRPISNGLNTELDGLKSLQSELFKQFNALERSPFFFPLKPDNSRLN